MRLLPWDVCAGRGQRNRPELSGEGEGDGDGDGEGEGEGVGEPAGCWGFSVS